jgi:type II secretory pathway pseudopilin PulG
MRAALRRGIARRRSDAGDTLIELLVAITIIGLSVAAILGGLASALGSSGTHRSLTNLDAILRSYAEVARYDIQMRPANQGGPLFWPCVPASYYVVASAPYPASGAPGTTVTVFGSGFTGVTGIQTATVKDSAGVTTTVAASVQVNVAGNFTATFALPGGLNSGAASVKITDGNNSANAASTFDINPSATTVNASSLANFQVGITGIQYWNGTSFQAACGDTRAPDNQVQELTVSGTAPGASDQLNIIVADSNYVFPPPQVVDTFLGQNSAPDAGYGFLADGAGYTIYADVVEPDGAPGIASVTADVSGITGGQTAVALLPVPGGPQTTSGGLVYNYMSTAALTAPSPGDGTTLTYTVNATDIDGLPSQYTGNGSVNFDTAPPTGSVSVDNVNGNGYVNTPGLSVSFSADDTESGVDPTTGQLVELSAPLVNGSCQGPLGNPITVATGLNLNSPQDDPNAISGNCYQYRYSVSDNVGNNSGTITSSVVKYDTVPPSLSLQFSNPTNVSVSGSTLTFGAEAPGGASFTVTANATDPVAGNLNYAFANPPGGWSVTTSAANILTYTSVLGASGGRVRVTVTNGAGLATTTTFRLVAYTGRPTPTVTVQTDANGYATSAPVVTFSATGDAHGLDTASGQLSQLSAPLSGGACGSFGNQVQVGSTGVTSPYQDTSVTSGYCYEYVYVVPDNLGNPGSFTSTPVKYDTTPPTVAVTYPVDGNTYTKVTGQSNTWAGTIAGTASDAASTLSSVVVAVQDTTTGMWWGGTAFNLANPQNAQTSGTPSAWTFALPATALTDGDQYQVFAKAIDAASLNNTATATFTG